MLVYYTRQPLCNFWLAEIAAGERGILAPPEA